jgi:Tol biopolymer transport system component
VVDGRIERSGTVRLALLDGVDTISPTGVTWHVTPAGSGTLGTDSLTGSAVLTPTVAGPLLLTATSIDGSASRLLAVSAPPKVVFTLLANGNRDIWVVALDGGDTARLTEDPADDRQPTAAQGLVVFLSSRVAGSGLYAVTESGEPAVPVLIGDLGDPALSSDGRRLAFTSAVTGVPKVWVANADGSDARRLAPSFGFDGAIEGWPAWSPDGAQLALMSTDPGAASLFQIDSAGTTPMPLIDTLTSFQPSWNPAGTGLAFSGSPPGGQASLYLMPTVPGAPVRITQGTDGGDSKPVWLPDGRIVYLATTAGGGAELRWFEPNRPDDWRVIPLPAGQPESPAYFPAP